MIATRDETRRRRHAAALGATGWLGLAAAPTFAIMALLTRVPGGDADMMCSAAQGASPLSGMAPMYIMMSAFHSAPWLKLISSRRHLTTHRFRANVPASLLRRRGAALRCQRGGDDRLVRVHIGDGRDAIADG